ncbi:MAG: hypothetical protein H5U13_13225 [Parvibaculum sp.]|nr:hypothetical protein [Parvibaculum sp.]
MTIDEFDEIHQELFLYGNLAETFFANLRALSTCENVCLILVGGENMPFVMERQGAKLNKFTRHSVSYFSRATEWEDFSKLVRKPSEGTILWHDDAISRIFNETNGNPFFANLVCGRILREAVKARDADVTSEEVKAALEVELESLDANSFAHLWQDGIFKPSVEREPDVLRRRKVLAAMARSSRKGQDLSVDNIADSKGTSLLTDGEISSILHEFARRGVLEEEDGAFSFRLPIFERWLREGGLAVVQPDPVSEELAAAIQAEEDAAFVRSDELASLVAKWPTYQGRHVSTDEVRAWYQQVSGFREQRILFKVLQSVRFINETELRERARMAYSQLRRQLSDFVRYALADRRTDILVTYLDGNGKSGEYFASLFAEENKISVSCICSPEHVVSRLDEEKAKGKTIAAVVVIDDVAVTGRSIASNGVRFLEMYGDRLKEQNVKFLLSTLYATKRATEYVLEQLKSYNVESDFRVGEVLSDSAFAFSDISSIWSNDDERDRARALITDLGSRVYKRQPLGYGGMGLLLVFPTTVPNNTLPILHSSSKVRLKPWRPLFPRPTN